MPNETTRPALPVQGFKLFMKIRNEILNISDISHVRYRMQPNGPEADSPAAVADMAMIVMSRGDHQTYTGIDAERIRIFLDRFAAEIPEPSPEAREIYARITGSTG